MNLSIGDKAPNFTLPDQDLSEHSLSDYAGQWVLLYFYPKDDTPGCTTEACHFRDSWTMFNELGATILGVSCDSPKIHQKFLNKYALPFSLLSDQNKDVVKAYGVWQPKILFAREYLGIVRTTFLIDPEGKIAKIYQNVKPDEHYNEVLKDLKKTIKEQNGF